MGSRASAARDGKSGLSGLFIRMVAFRLSRLEKLSDFESDVRTAVAVRKVGCLAKLYARLWFLSKELTMQNAETTIETPLAPVHRGAGAKIGVWFGCAL